MCTLPEGPLTLLPLPHTQAEVFEEIATMDFPFEGIPTVPPRKDMDHMVRRCAAHSTASH